MTGSEDLPRDADIGVKGCKWVEVPKFSDERGSLSFMEQNEHVPFNIKRLYYIYDVTEEETRGYHAHEELKQLVFSLNGQVEFVLDDGRNRDSVLLNEPNKGLFIPSMIWREMKNFSPESVYLVVASEYYDEEDYINDYETFKSSVDPNSNEL